jgi:hypothetical protein
MNFKSRESVCDNKQYKIVGKREKESWKTAR